MKVFISWSGPRSKHVATALRDWLPDVIQSVEPWMSETDIHAESDWLRDLRSELSKESFGVFCLTPENLNAPWLWFEAGALAKSVETARVCPYLLALRPSDVEQPLSVFQGKTANREGTWDLVRSINAQEEDDQQRLSPERLKKAFEKYWDDLELRLKNVPDEPAEVIAPRRTDREVLEEVLELVRSQSRSQRNPWGEGATATVGTVGDLARLGIAKPGGRLEELLAERFLSERQTPGESSEDEENKAFREQVAKLLKDTDSDK